MQAVVTFSVNVLVAVEEVDGVFLADCPFLNVVSQGRSEEEALERFQEELQFLFETCQKAEDLEALLEHRTRLRASSEATDEKAGAGRKFRRVPAEIPAGLLNRLADAAASFH